MKLTLEFYWFYLYFFQIDLEQIYHELFIYHPTITVLRDFVAILDINDNGKPILRIGEDFDDNISTTSAILKNTTTLQWLKDLRARISQLVNEYGYKDAKPYIQRLVEETEKEMKVLLHVEVAQDGTSSIEVGPTFRSKKNKKHSISRVSDGEALKNEPPWVKDLKTFMKALVQSYGWIKSKHMMDNLIETIEKQNGVSVQDIDREVLIRYSNKTLNYILDQQKRKKIRLEE